jgi:hypothetical protein
MQEVPMSSKKKPVVMPQEPVALVDMDGTLCDFDGAMQRDLERLRSPGEPIYINSPDNKDEPYIEARKLLIKNRPGWWRELTILEAGRQILWALKEVGFQIQILTKAPSSTPAAWTEKVEWCRQRMPEMGIPDFGITITGHKGLVYGKVLADDWPPYILSWLEHRPRGLVIMPDQPWNKDFKHPQVLRYFGGNFEEMIDRLRIVKRVSSSEA